MDYKETARQIIELSGGKKNITSVTHCATRLRFVLADNDASDQEAISMLIAIIVAIAVSAIVTFVIGFDEEDAAAPAAVTDDGTAVVEVSAK